MSDVQPADPNKGFPNPLAPEYEGVRTPEEQVAFERAEAERQAIADAAAKAPAADAGETPPANPTGTEQATY